MREVTAAGAPAGQRVTQVFCSALPVAYSRVPAAAWPAHARRLFKKRASPSKRDRPLAIRRAVRQVRGMDLDVRLVSRVEPSAAVRELVAELDG